MADESLRTSWSHVYLLGWYDEQGKPYLTTWEGDLPMVDVVVTGASAFRMPLWKAPIPPNAQLHEFPDDVITLEQKISYARSIGGYYAFGWLSRESIDRTIEDGYA